jgi:hypothetical protein
MSADSKTHRDWVLPTLIAAALGFPWLASSSDMGTYPQPTGSANYPANSPYGIPDSSGFYNGTSGAGMLGQVPSLPASYGGSNVQGSLQGMGSSALNWPAGGVGGGNPGNPTGTYPPNYSGGQISSPPWGAATAWPGPYTSTGSADSNAGFAQPPIISPPGRGQVILPGNQFGPDFAAQPLEFMPVNQLGEVIRYDVTPEWVTQRWERVSRLPNSEGLVVYRVPLVTGINAWDLHGSLSYYFDGQQRVQRILFRGWTGDPTQLIQLITGQHQLQTRSTDWTGLYTLERWGTTCSACLIQQPNVIRNSNANEKFAIHLELNQPTSNLVLTPESEQLVREAKNSAKR